MTEPASPSPQAMGLFARALGVITSPRATFENVVAVPRPFGILFVCALLIGIGASIPQFTEEARKQTLEAQIRGMERWGVTVTPEMYQKFEESSRNPVNKVFGALAPLVAFPILALLLTSVFWAFFNAILGGTATFKQVLAVTAHSYVITALGILLSVPIQLYRFTMALGGPFNLGALVPMMDESSPIVRFLSSVSVFSLWGWIVVAIGLAVLYRRNSRNIAIVLVILSLVFSYVMSAIFGAFSGGS